MTTLDIKVNLLTNINREFVDAGRQVNADLLASTRCAHFLADDGPEAAIDAHLSNIHLILERHSRELQLMADEVRDCLEDSEPH